MTKKMEVYKCEICGNMVEMVHEGGGTLVCCGEAMECITTNLTMVNLMKAFAGESQARNKYEYYAKVAQKEGYRDIAAHFQRAANNEKEHAKLELKLKNMMQDGQNFGDTVANLKDAIAHWLDIAKVATLRLIEAASQAKPGDAVFKAVQPFVKFGKCFVYVYIPIP